MSRFGSCWRGCMVGAAALLTIGLAQLQTSAGFKNASGGTHAVPTHRHAPMIRLYGPGGAPLRGEHNESVSGNWSGYALTAGNYSSTSATWTVPSVSYATYSDYPSVESSSSWIGIGGDTDSTLVQLGTEQDVSSGGGTTYQAWYEFLPASETPLPVQQYPVSPGDVMSASIICTASCSAYAQQIWYLAMTNQSKGWTWSASFAYTSSMQSVEWIQEAPTNGGVLPLANFHEIQFSAVAVNGQNPNLSLSANGIILSDNGGNDGTANPCAATGGNQFSIVYGNASCSAVPPPAPTALAATGVSCTGFQANWTSSSGASGYDLDVATSSNFSGEQTFNIANGAATGVGFGTPASTTFYYRVRAYGTYGTSNNSNAVSVTTLPSPAAPAAPSASAATNVTSSSFSANWGAVSGASGYQLDVATDSGFANFVTGFQNLDVGTSVSEAVSGLSASTTYYYRVRAYAKCGNSIAAVSGNSNVVGVTTSAPPPPPAPTATAPTGVTQTSFVANWSAASGATAYWLDVSTSSTFSSFVTGYNNLDVGNVQNATVSGLQSNATYYYRVRASNAEGTSGNSNTITAQTLYPAQAFAVPSANAQPWGIAVGPDGALWFTEAGGSSPKIGHVTTAGVINEFTYTAGGLSNGPGTGIVAGPDGAVWFVASYWNSNNNLVWEMGRMTTAGVATFYSIPSGASMHWTTGIAQGADGNLWFTESPTSGTGNIARIVPSTHVVTEFPVSGNLGPYGITAGPNSALWFTEPWAVTKNIGSISTAGAVGNLYNGHYQSGAITAGPDGNLWYASYSSNVVGKMTPAGVDTEYTLPSSNASTEGITLGPDGALWFTEGGNGKIGRITTGGVITEYQVGSPGTSNLNDIVTGPDGALWITDTGANQILRFAPSGSTARAAHDFNGDGKSDILWRNTSGNTALWLMNAGAVVQSGGFGTVPSTWGIVGQRDFNGDGHADLLWRDASGNTSIWLMNGATVSSTVGLGNVPTTWAVSGTGDLNGDGTGDLLWRDTAGDIAIWFFNGGAVTSTASLGNVPTTWTIVGDDNKGDIFWHDNAGNYAVWHLNGSQVTATAGIGNVPLATWHIAGFGDFNGDGNTDIVWRDTSGNTAIWLLNSALGVQGTAGLGNISTAWTIAQIGDYNGDGYSDIVWQDTSGNVAVWFMNGGTVTSTAGLGNVGTTWQLQSVNAE